MQANHGGLQTYFSHPLHLQKLCTITFKNFLACYLRPVTGILQVMTQKYESTAEHLLHHKFEITIPHPKILEPLEKARIGTDVR